METQKVYQMDCDGDLRITAMDRAVLKPPYVHLRRRMKEYVLYYMVSGELYLSEEGRQVTLRANDVYILDPDAEHFGIRATECTYFYVHFFHEAMKTTEMDTEQFRDMLIDRRLASLKASGTCRVCGRQTELGIPKMFHVSDPGAAVTLTEILQRIQISNESNREFHQKNTECMLWEFLIAYSREITNHYLSGTHTAANTRSICMVYDLLSYFQENYAFEFTSVWIEERYHCSYDHLNRTFKKVIGTTIFAYLNGLRISHAKQFLLAGAGTMAEIAEKCGFHDIYYFSRVFKKYTGITPGTFYRRS